MPTELEIAVDAARQAGKLLLEGFHQHHSLLYKGDINFATEVDHRSEVLIAHILKDSFPEDGFVGEENTLRNQTAHRKWIVDPLDGTTNYARGYPYFAVSIGLEEDGIPLLGVVYNPILDEMFSAQRGQGAALNGSPIHVSDTATLGQALLASGFPYEVWNTEKDNMAEFMKMVKRTMSVRNDGSAALDICYTACGRLDGYWEQHVQPWDIAAGVVILTEAGGQASLYDGSPFDLYGHSMLASNGSLHQTILQVLKSD